MRALLDTRPASDRTGIGRYARTIQATLCGELGAHRVWSLGGVGGELRFAPLDRAAEELELPAHLVRESIDLYHSPLFRLPACLPCRSVITIHDAIPLVRPDLSDPRFTALFHAEAKSAVERADRIVCPSDAAKGDLVGALSIDEGKVAVIPESPDPVFRPLPRESTRSALERMGVDLPYVLVVGRVEHRKNPHAILDAVGLLPEGEPLVVFVGPLGDVNLPA